MRVRNPSSLWATHYDAFFLVGQVDPVTAFLITRVARAAKDDWRSVTEIAKSTGLTAKQVHGVIAAKDFGKRFHRKKFSDGVRIKYIEDEGKN